MFEKWFCITCSEELFPFNRIYDEIDFKQAIYETCPIKNKNNISLEALNNKIFNPFQLNEIEDANSILPLTNTDPDLNYYGGLENIDNYISSDYYTEDSFSNKCLQLSADSFSLSLLHLNIRSLPKHLNEFEVYIKNLNVDFSIYGFSETWLNDNNATLFTLSGYNHICNYRTKRLGGGVSLYVKQTLKYQHLSDLEIFNENLETIFIEIPKDVIGSKSNIIVGIIYRPPDRDITQFNDYIINILSQFKQTNKVIYIMGDFNINLLNSEKHVKTSEFLENMYSFSFFSTDS